MPDPGLAEVAALSTAQENLATAPQNRTRRLAENVSRDIANGHFREGLKRHAEAQNVDFTNIDRRLNAFGTDIDPTTGEVKLTTNEQSYKTAIETARTEIEAFFDKGYDGMSGPQQTRLREIILLQARRNPMLTAQINALGANEQAFAERFIKDPNFSADLKAILNQNIEGNFDNSVLDAFDAWKGKQQILEDVTAEEASSQRRLDETNTRLRQFERRATTGNAVRPTSSAGEIDNIRRSKAAIDADIAKFQSEVSTGEQKLKSLREELARAKQIEAAGLRPITDIDSDLTNAKDKLTDASTELGKLAKGDAGYDAALNDYRKAERKVEDLDRERRERIRAGTNRSTGDIESEIGTTETALGTSRTNLSTEQAKLDRVPELEATEEQLETTRRELEEKLTEIRGRKRTAETDVNVSKRTYDSAIALREAMEKTFSDKITNSFGEAASKTINEYMQKIANQFDASLAKLKGEEQDQHSREALTAIQSRWQMPPETRQRGPWWNRRTETYRPINKTQIGTDFDTLLNQGDREFVRAIIGGRNNPATNAPYTPDEITSLLDNQAFMGKIGPEAVKQVIGQRMLNGGLRAEDINIISRSAWGQDMVNKAVEQNGQFRSQLQTVMGQEALNRHSVRERFGQVANEHPWLIYSLLGIPIAGIMSLTMGATSEVLNNQR